MERDHKRNHQESPTLLSHVNVKEEYSPRKPLGGGGNGGTDRLKRDEWSEEAVSNLLEVYEAKWALRNRAKLKGQDWEDVARHVSSSTKSPKTPTQCKNKIESMKKRYRAESAGASADHVSSWPLFSRLHQLLGGPTGNGGGGCGVGPLPPPPPPPVQPSPPPVEPSKNQCLALVEALTAAQPQPQPPLNNETAQNSLHYVGPQQEAKEERLHGNEAKVSDQVSDGAKSPMAMDTDSSTPAQYECKDRNAKLNSKMKVGTEKRKRKRRRRSTGSGGEADTVIAESIRWLAEAVVKSEQVRMEATREVEKMRMDAEAKRAEIDLKRTEIIANTQLEIARIFAACASSSGSKNVDSSAIIRKN